MRFLSLLALAGLAAAQASIEQVVVLGRLCPSAGSYSTNMDPENTAVTMGFDGIQSGDGAATCSIIIDMAYPPGCNRVTFRHVIDGFTSTDEGSDVAVTISAKVSSGFEQTVRDTTFTANEVFSRRYLMDGTVRVSGDNNDAVRITVDLTALVEPSGTISFDSYTFSLLDMEVMEESRCN